MEPPNTNLGTENSREIPAQTSTNKMSYNQQNKNDISTDQKISISPSVMATLDRQKQDSNENNNGGSGNNSDNSGLVSMGNNSFGFNFDNEYVIGGIGGTGNNSAGSEQNDSDQHCDMKESSGRAYANRKSQGTTSNPTTDSVTQDEKSIIVPRIPIEQTLSFTNPVQGLNSKTSESQSLSDKTILGQTGLSVSEEAQRLNTNNEISSMKTNKEAVTAAVQNLRSVVKASSAKWKKVPVMVQSSNWTTEFRPKKEAGGKQASASGREDDDSDGGGYNTDDEGDDNVTVNSCSIAGSKGSKDQPPKKRNKKIDNCKREERNAREKERSFRISRQINELRSLLSSGGVIVPKGTKSSVLTEAANYIRMLQQHQYRSEIDRHQLIQQMQMIGAGALGPQAANTIRHVAAQNGVWSLGNFGGVPPRAAMSFYNHQANDGSGNAATNAETDVRQVKEIEEHEYRDVFNYCAVAMAIASMGGAFIDCNELFCSLSQYSKQEVCAMTIFNMTSRSDLQHAFDLISKMISPSSNDQQNHSPCILQGSMKNRNDLGLSISLIRGEDDGIAKCFCVTLVNNASPFSSRPTPALSNLIIRNSLPQQNVSGDSMNKPQAGDDMSSPAYTTG